MLQLTKHYFWIVLLAVGLDVARGFSLLGPLPPDPGGEPWQIFAIGYGEGGVSYTGAIPGAPDWLQDIGGPHNLGEEYRRSTPVIYYTYDPSFTAGDFFGAEGMAAVDSAFATMNSVTNVDNYSANLSEFPLSSQENNYRAQALYLSDLKSATLHLLVEQLGLADPARYAWTLHSRVPGTACPITTTYLVVQRNFDVVPSALSQVQYSPYVNGALLSYYISEVCSGSSLLASTVPFLTDPDGQQYGPIAANNFMGDWNANEFESSEILHVPVVYGLQIGGYYTGLTRDDVAGLRYLFSTNNVNYEPIPRTSLMFTVVTNFTTQQQFPSGSATNTVSTNGLGFYSYDGTFGYGDYGWLVATSQTNSPAVLQALYPGLVISSSSNYFVLATNWTYTQYFTNASGYGQPYPPVLTLVTVSNGTPYWLQKYVTAFANVFTNNVRTNTTFQLQTISVVPNTGAPYGSPPLTNTSTQTVTQNIPSGDFFLLPQFHTNICPLDIISAGLPNVLAITNILTGTSTNVVASTNTATGTNISTYSSSLIQINYFTNYTWITHPVSCAEVSNASSLFQGIGGAKFVRADYDALLSQSFHPITNYYTMVALNTTNGQWQLQHLVRVVTQPDIVLAAADLALANHAEISVVRNINYNSSQILNNLHGPGLIDSPSTFVYNKVGTAYFNGPFTDANSFLNPTEVNETTQIPGLQWASYDGSTNDPVVYPNGTSIQNLENQVVIQLTSTPSGPLVGSTTNTLSVQFRASGGAVSQPFTWSATGYPIANGVLYGLPPGLTVDTITDSDGTTYGLLHGTPTSSGTYDFILQLSDSLGRSVQWNLSITIN